MNAFVSAIPSSPMSLLFLPPEAPSGLVAAGVIETQVRLEWIDNSDDEAMFMVQRRGPDADWTDVQTLPADTTTFVDRGLVPGATYDYRVRAASAVGNSRWSNAVTVTTLSPLPAPPANLEAVPISPTQISLT